MTAVATTTVRLVKKFSMDELDSMLLWLRDSNATYRFSQGGSLLIFDNPEDATAFKIKYG